MNFAAMQTKAFSAARMGVKTSVMKAGGWVVGQANEQQMVQPAIFFYVHDHQTRWTWMCSLPKNLFFEAAQNLPSYEMGMATHGVAHLVEQASKGMAQGEWEEDLAKLLSAYIIKTSTYERAGQGNLAPHFLVVHYGNTQLLRPAAINGSDQFALTAQQVMEAFVHIVTLDGVRNPQWVKG